MPSRLRRLLSACIPQSGRSFVFGVFAVALITAKGIRLVTHAFAVPILALLFFLPTFLFFDFLSLCICRLLLWSTQALGTAKWLLLPSVLGYLLSAFTLGAAAAQLSFFLETGGELEFREASSYVTSLDGLRVLLTGSFAMLVSAAVMIVVAWFLSDVLYHAWGGFLTICGQNLMFGKWASA